MPKGVFLLAAALVLAACGAGVKGSGSAPEGVVEEATSTSEPLELLPLGAQKRNAAFVVGWKGLRTARYTLIVATDAACGEAHQIVRISDIVGSSVTVSVSNSGAYFVCLEALDDMGKVVARVEGMGVTVVEGENAPAPAPGPGPSPGPGSGPAPGPGSAPSPGPGSSPASAPTPSGSPLTGPTPGPAPAPAPAPASAPVNHAPTAANDAASAQQAVAKAIAVLANDTDVDAGDTLRISAVTQPTNGTTTITGTTVTYTSNGGFVGVDTFQYTVADDAGATHVATVTVGVFAAPAAYSFVGSAGASWSDPASWHGGQVPGVGDVVRFSAACGPNCMPVLDGAISVAGIVLDASFTGTLKQDPGATLTIGASGFVQGGGTFEGGDGAITVSGPFNITGGDFTSTSGTLTVDFGYAADEDVVFVHDAGTFDANDGLVVFKTLNWMTCEAEFRVRLNAPSTTFHHLETETWGHSHCGSLSNLNLLGKTLNVEGNFTQKQGYVDNGLIVVKGNVVTGADADGGTATIRVVGAGVHTYEAGATGYLPRLTLAADGGSLVPAAGTTRLAINTLTLEKGTLQAPTGTLSIHAPTDDPIFVQTDGVFVANGGKVYLHSTSWFCDPHFGMTTAQTVTFQDLEIDVLRHGNCGDGGTLALGASTRLVVAGELRQTNGALTGGTIEAYGPVVASANADGGTTILQFSGNAVQDFTVGAGGFVPVLRIEKTGGEVRPAGATSTVEALGLQVVSGTFKAPSDLILGSRAGDGTTLFQRTGGTFAHNNGKVTFRGTNWVCDPNVHVVTTGAQFYDVAVDVQEHGNCGDDGHLVLGGGTLDVARHLTLTNGHVNNGIIAVGGDVLVQAGFAGGTAGLTFAGAAQSYTNAGGGEPDGNWLVTATSTLTLTTNMNVNAAGQSLTVDGGTLDRDGFTITGSTSVVNGGQIVN